jgi:ribosome maturation factor RimP
MEKTDRKELKKRVEKAVADAVGPVIAEMGYELVEAEFTREGGEDCLSIYIDRTDEKDVSIADCEKVSVKVDPIIDGISELKGPFNFDVSSPGLDRPLKSERDFTKYAGQPVEVKLYEAIDGNKLFEGELLGSKDGIISIKDDKGQVLNFPKEKTVYVKRSVVF